jgi:hypothetical protein
VSGSLPFDGSSLKDLRERVLRGKYRIPFYMSTECEQLLKKFMVRRFILGANLAADLLQTCTHFDVQSYSSSLLTLYLPCVTFFVLQRTTY